MNTIQRTKEFIIIAFLLSLLFHTSSVFYVIWQGNNNKSEALQEKEEILKQKLQSKREEWVETKARAGNFGAPVLFQDEPFHADTQILDEPTQDALEEKSEEKTETILRQAQDERREDGAQRLLVSLSNDQDERREDGAQHSLVSLSNDQDEQRKDKAQQQEQKQPRKKKTTKKTRQKHATEQTTQNFLPPPKPPLSLAQLAQGFLHHLKNEGTHAIHMLGKKTGMPSDEQIKYERYLQKLNWCLQNSFNINKNRIPPSTSIHDTLHITLVLNKDGSMQQCSISKKSENPHFDQFALFIFNDASTSFPPVPSYLPHTPFTITYIVACETIQQQGTAIHKK